MSVEIVFTKSKMFFLTSLSSLTIRSLNTFSDIECMCFIRRSGEVRRAWKPSGWEDGIGYGGGGLG
jgi:hypothetical protein